MTPEERKAVDKKLALAIDLTSFDVLHALKVIRALVDEGPREAANTLISLQGVKDDLKRTIKSLRKYHDEPAT